MNQITILAAGFYASISTPNLKHTLVLPFWMLIDEATDEGFVRVGDGRLLFLQEANSGLGFLLSFFLFGESGLPSLFLTFK